MKVAYCLSGLIDNITPTIHGLNEIQSSQDIDFFCHTWDDPKNPGRDIINQFPFKRARTSTYKDFEDHILSQPSAEELYSRANSQKDKKHFFRTHMAQFYSTIKCVERAVEYGDYDIIIKARSNLRYEKSLCNNLKNNLIQNIQPILNREVTAWNHFQQPNSDDRPDTNWDFWPSCLDGIQTVFAPSFTFPIWKNNAPFIDTMFAMEQTFAKKHILEPNFLENIINTFMYFADNTDTLAMEADKVWFRYLMDNNVAIFGFPVEMWMTRNQKIII